MVEKLLVQHLFTAVKFSSESPLEKKDVPRNIDPNLIHRNPFI